MRAGMMRDRIVIQRWFPATSPPDTRFNEDGMWIPVASGWANVIQLDGSEVVNSQAVQSQVSHRVTMRYLANVTSKHQVVYRGSVLDVVSVIDPDGRRRTLVLECRANPTADTEVLL